MKIFALLMVILASVELSQAQKDAVFLDPAGDTTTFEDHHSYQISGKYKSVYDRKSKTKKLVPFPPEELQEELQKTRKKTVLKEKLGEDFPPFEVSDINGNQYSKNDLNGKVLVVNFWFIGCAPCEMERPDLNQLVEEYRNNPDVVFLSFAKNNEGQLKKFLFRRPFLYAVVPLDKELIAKFGVAEYPQNQIVGKDGKYVFNSKAAGIGSGIILRQAIEEALEKDFQ